MNYQVFRQKPDQERKDYYRRMAELRKNKWRKTYRLQNQQQFKFHFFKQDEDVESQDSKTKKNSKNSIKSQQRIRNRMAAQQSRERHRTYVQELEQKVKVYQQIVQKRGLVCRRCKQELTSDYVKGEMSLLCAQETQGCKSKDDNLLQSQINESVIRIDNGGVTTPFGIFFVFCLFSILLAFIPTNGEKPRALFHQETVIRNENQKVLQMDTNQFSRPMSFVQFVRSQKRAKVEEQCTSAEEKKQQEQVSIPRSNFKTFIPQAPSGKQKWTKVGNYFCSKPQIVMQIQPKKKTPYFLLLHTQKKQHLQTLKSQSDQNLKIQPTGWKKIQISQCYLGQQ